MKILRVITSIVLLVFVSSILSAAPLYWDASATGGASLGGTGNWDQSSSLWFNGIADIAWTNANNDDAIFSGTAGTVTLTENIAAGNLFFTNATGNYLITNATGAEILTVAGTIDTGGGEHTIAAPIANSTTLTKSGDGRLHLPADSSATLSGNVAVNQGVISVENNNALGSASTTVATGAAVEVNGGTNGLATILNNITVNGTGITNTGAIRNTSGNNFWYGAVTLGSSGSLIDSDSGTLEFDNGISDSSGDSDLFISGAGIIRLHYGGINLGNNGTLTVNSSGTLSINQSSAYSATYSNLVINGGAFLLGGQEANLGTVPATLLTNQVTINGGSLQTSGTLTISNNRGITVTTNGGAIEENSGTLTTANIYSENANVTFYANTASSGKLHINWSNPTGQLNLGTGTLIKSGPGDMNVGAGTIAIFSNLVVTGGSYTWTAANGDGVGFVSSSFESNNITLNGGALHYAGSFTFNANRGFFLDTNNGVMQSLTTSGNVIIGGVVSGPGSLEVQQGKTGTSLRLAANNTYAGGTIIDAGPTLYVGTNSSSGTLGTGNVANNGTLVFNRSDAAYSFGGIVSGTGSVTQGGSGTTTLTGNNTYSGGTTISAGTLFINNTSGSGTGSGSVTVNTNATLGGTGAIAGAVTINAGGTLALGSGILTLNSSLSLAGNVSVQINKLLSPSNGMAVVSGAPANTGTGIVNVSNLGPALSAGDTFKLFSQPVSGGAAMQVSGGGVIWNNNLAVDGTISVQSLSSQPVINNVSISNGNFVLSGTNGSADGAYYLLSSTNLALPLSSWTRVLTNSFDGSGQFSITNAMTPGAAQNFYILQLQ